MYGQTRVVIKKYNRDAAVLLSVEEYERLVNPAKRNGV
ncbi:MAG: type II toxin-antitoxin system prevent-host-death family antitoxin [Candidatus Daviesbacteria bacterium]|nr:type II toxin-antitoxin system prevent-host-death family antitoxin [Candidatus Daviesbacteria bacterium]